ncbi:MAG: FMN-binding protein [Christensenellales bacterium]
MILTAQSIDVDSVSSATVTSNAIKAAVADCIAQAGGNAQALKSVAEKSRCRTRSMTWMWSSSARAPRVFPPQTPRWKRARTC